MLDDLSDQMPFSIQVHWDNHNIELLILPELCDEKSEMRFTVYRKRSEIGIIVHDHTLTDGWVWLKGHLGQEKAELIGERIDSHYQ